MPNESHVEGAMSGSESREIDFEEWAALVQSDPDAFEARRAEAIEAFIRSAPPHRQERLRRLQWRIDQVRRTSKTPLAACLRISRLMWDSVHGRGGLRETLERLGATLGGAAAVPPPKDAQILEFSPDRRRNLHVGP